MSRWNKNRNQAFAVPIDSLIKEKENTNRPTAARSAGTVGKWGVTSFTSIRGVSIYGKNGDLLRKFRNKRLFSGFLGRSGFSQFSPKQEPSPSAYISPTQEPQLSQNAPNIEPPKPKKFFKSRNAPPEPFLIQSPQTSPSVEGPRPANFYTTAPAGTSGEPQPPKGPGRPRKPRPEKAEKKKSTKSTKKTKAIAEGEEKVAKVTKTKAEGYSKAATAVPSKRYLARNRKVVNYSEDNSRSPSPERIQYAPPAEAAPSPPKSAPLDHPPIVLRISKVRVPRNPIHFARALQQCPKQFSEN